MRALQTWYEGHARYVQGLAEQAKDHVQNFSKALTDVPPYRTVLDAERELKAAMQSNARAGGAHRACCGSCANEGQQALSSLDDRVYQLTRSQNRPRSRRCRLRRRVPVPTAPPAVPSSGPGDGPVGSRESQHLAQERPLGPGAGRSRCGTELDPAGRRGRPGPPIRLPLLLR